MAIIIGNKYDAVFLGNEYVQQTDGEYRIIEFTTSDIPETLNFRAVIEPELIRENSNTVAMEYEWQFQLGTKWETVNGVNTKGKLRTRAHKHEFVNLLTGEVVDESVAKDVNGDFNNGFNTSYYHVMRSFPISGNGFLGAMIPMADLFFEMHFNNKVLPKYV